MTLKAVELETELIETVCARVRDRLPGQQATGCQEFVRQYYHWVPAEDLADRSELDLYGAAVAHWNLAQQRSPGETKVHVYNPDFEQHGWQSPHTVVEIVSDDVPFVVDSVTMELSRQEYGIHLVIHPVIRVRRDAGGRLIDLLEPGAEASDAIGESILHAEVDRAPDREPLDRLRAGVERALGQVSAAVEDWQAMRAKARALTVELDRRPVPGDPVDPAEQREAKAFLDWLADDNFTFLGYREYNLVVERGQARLRAIPGSGLGILGGEPATAPKPLTPRGRELAFSRHVLVLTKANSRATVHRPAYMDYVGVRKFGADGEVTGERRFLGLYTARAYKASPREIPMLRGRVERVMERAGFPPDSHDAKVLTGILESYPRDELFQLKAEELFEIAMGLLGLGERQRVRLWVSRDVLDRFVSCLVTIPRDRFNTENRECVEQILKHAFGATNVDYTIQVTESVLVRLH